MRPGSNFLKGGEIINLTEKDIELFRLITTSGVCTLEQAKKVYNANKWYHYKRIQRLQQKGYLIKRGSYIELSTKGAEMLGESKYRFRRDEIREAHIEVANITLALKEFEILSNREVRQEYGLNRKTHFKNVLVYNNLYYFIYLLSEKPAQVLINSIKAELKTFASSGIARHSIIFAPTPTAMAMFGIDHCKQDELFLLPYPSGLELLKTHFNNPIKINAPITTKPFADYETDDCYIAVLTLNNIARRYALSAYYRTHQVKPVVILCLNSQKDLFARQYPKAKLQCVEI